MWIRNLMERRIRKGNKEKKGTKIYQNEVKCCEIGSLEEGKTEEEERYVWNLKYKYKKRRRKKRRITVGWMLN